MDKNLTTILLLFAAIGLSFCSSTDSKYQIETYFDKATQDTLMADIITNIYKVPRGVDPKKKSDPEFRNLYVNQIPLFQFVYYYIDPNNSTHYFYLIRPARNEKGHKRGVLGKFKLDDNLKFIDFEEISVTPMLPEEKILENGEFLWNDLMYFGNVDRYFLNKQFIEFPDERTRYDKVKREWTYEKF